MQDIRYALRSLRKQPIFTLVAVLTLTLGIGANTAIFSLLYQILLRPLPYPDADRLVFVWNTYPGINLAQASVSIPDYIDRKTQAPALEDATLFTFRSANLNEGGNPEQLRALAVTPSFFSTLQRQPFLGRGFTEDEAKPDADKYVILTYALWTSHYGSSRDIVGKDIRINGEAHRVVGVLPADFELFSPEIALLVPFSFTPQQMSDSARGNEFSQMVARLRPGATIAQANAQFKIIVDRNIERLPVRAAFARSSGFGGYAVSLREQLVGDVRGALYLVQAGVIVVLLIACANVANLLLMRATGRYRELAIRSTLGAGRARIVRQLLTEGIVLSIAGAVGGVALGWLGVKALIAMASQQIPGAPTATIHSWVLLFTLGLAVITGLVFGLVPAVTIASGNVAAFLKDDSARGTAGKSTGMTRTLLVVAETALAVMLLIGAGLLIKSFVRLQDVNPGFSSENVLTAQIALPAVRYPDAPARAAFWQRLLEKARTIPGVTTAGLTSNVPFNGNVSSGSYSIVGVNQLPGDLSPHGRQEVIGGDYFKAMQIPLVAGRTFTDADTATAPPVVVIDEYLVKKYFASRSPLGQQIQRGANNRFTIVGVVGTINSIDLGEPVTKERIYYPAAQLAPRTMAIVLKTGLDPQTLVSAVRAAVRSIDPEQPLSDVRTMDQWVARSLQTRRTPMALLALFGAVALVLSAIGIYGVLAFGVAQRVREFGIRQALGADSGSILTLVLSQGLRTAGLGVVLGLAGSFALTRYLQSLLFGVGTHDLTVFGAVTLLLMLVAAVACYVPARKATRVDPMVALRES
jgi:predicted permease